MKATVRCGRAMGSPLRLTLAGSHEAEADAAWRIVADLFGRADRSLSRFDPASPLSRLNRAAGSGRSLAVEPMLARALAAAWRAFRVSRGRFDPRIIGALEAAGERAGVPLPPSPPRLGPGDRWLCLDVRRRRARLAAPIDLGGIGKGLALRWTASALRRAGAGDLLVQAGGDLVALGHGPGGRPWVVAIEDPAGGQHPLALVELVDEAIATSSTVVRRWRARDGGMPHHLIDPTTLQPSDAPWLSVTVRHPDPAWAEIATKAAFLGAGPSLPAASGTWRVTADGTLQTAP